jgi:RimJ/RimL family protein N-acetyltransferase
MTDLSDWTARALPSREAMEGRHVRLEPLDTARHGDGLFEASSTPDAGDRFRYLAEFPPANRGIFDAWLEKAASTVDPMVFVVIDRATGKIAGRQSFMRIDTTHGVIEVGSILWTGLVARRTAATEAIYLFGRHAFDDLGYRRFEWKCDNRNEPSKRAAIRFGFQPEGVFRKHMVVKGENRDTAWYAMTDDDWPRVRAAFEAWLDPSNFDETGNQIARLQELREEAGYDETA